MTEDMIIRPMTVDDIDEVMEIEHLSFTLPWSRQAYINEITKNLFAKYYVVEDHGSVIAFCGCWTIIDEAHITNIAVLPEYRGRKIGEMLLRYVMGVASLQGAKTMTLEARVSNVVARNLYQKLGFQEGGIRKNYYSDNGEDAIVMWVNLG